MNYLAIYQCKNSPANYPRYSFQKLADDCVEMAEMYPSCSPQDIR